MRQSRLFWGVEIRYIVLFVPFLGHIFGGKKSDPAISFLLSSQCFSSFIETNQQQQQQEQNISFTLQEQKGARERSNLSLLFSSLLYRSFSKSSNSASSSQIVRTREKCNDILFKKKSVKVPLGLSFVPLKMTIQNLR